MPQAPAAGNGRKDALRLAIVVALAAAGLAALLVWANRPGTPLPAKARIDRLVVLKSAHRLLAYEQGRLLKTYRVSSGFRSGPKLREGDLRTPEGSYLIDRHNGASRFHRALHVSYPSPGDLRRARASGSSPGGDIMIHGLPNGLGWVGRAHLLANWTAGCIALTDPEIEELYRATPDGTPIEIRP
jgi:murein L,D-transpeptidase YafK